jgi:hypothetical protein
VHTSHAVAPRKEDAHPCTPKRKRHGWASCTSDPIARRTAKEAPSAAAQTGIAPSTAEGAGRTPRAAIEGARSPGRRAGGAVRPGELARGDFTRPHAGHEPRVGGAARCLRRVRRPW